ncbi:MAG: tetratricopeptide (TPR) repeat protein [Myxococcota bacterium]|jgi:tetratricopeptide (TPR) repeat protein
MDDTVGGTGWLLDDDTRRALRLDRIERKLKLGAFEDAVVEAEEMLDDTPDDADGLILLGDASLETGDIEVATAAFEHALRVNGGRSARGLQGLAIARFELCDLVGCVEAAREALRLDPSGADAHFFLGLALDRLGHTAEAATSFAAALHLSPEAYPFPLDLSEDDWQRSVASAMHALDPEIRRFWSEVPILLETEPPVAELRAANPPISPRVSGLYIGSPPEDDDPWASRPEALRLFTRALARNATLDDVVSQIVDTLHAEALTWLGTVAEPSDP